MHSNNKDILIFDSTLRDGSHSLRHQLTQLQVSNYCEAVDNLGFDAVMVGHGNGLGASSILIGESRVTDNELLSSARKSLKNTKLGAFIIPGLATIQFDIDPALELGVDVFMVATHCTEASAAKQYVKYLSNKQKEVYGVLMMYHMTSKERLKEEVLKFIDYGVTGVIIMDSAGRSTPWMVAETIEYLVRETSTKIGFHAHNNLGIAVSNTFDAIKNGATIIDATIRGLGAGAGNCQLEQIIPLLQLDGYTLNFDLNKLFRVSDEIVFEMNKSHNAVDSISISSGLAGVFSGFKPYVIEIAKKHKISPYSLFFELGKNKVVAGQEDIIEKIALGLLNQKG